MLCYLIYVKNMKMHFITPYVPNSKYKLHRTRKFCRTYELQYTHCFFPGKDWVFIKPFEAPQRGVLIANFEHISNLVLVFLLVTLSR